MADHISFRTGGTGDHLRLDMHDDHDTFAVLLVIYDTDDDPEISKGEIQLPTLGISVPLFPGDTVFFQSAVLPHKIVHRDLSDREKPAIATWLTCQRDGKFLQDAMTALESRLPSDHIVKEEVLLDNGVTPADVSSTNNDNEAHVTSDRPVKEEEHDDASAGVSAIKIEPVDEGVRPLAHRVDDTSPLRPTSINPATKRKSRTPETEQDGPLHGLPAGRIPASRDATVNPKPIVRIEEDESFTNHPVRISSSDDQQATYPDLSQDVKPRDNHRNIKAEDMKREGDQ